MSLSHRLTFTAATALISALISVSAHAADTTIDGTVVTVPGTETSPWTVGGKLYIGYSLTGAELTVSDGATVSNTNGYVAYEAGSTGSVSVTAEGSSWTNSLSPYIGYGGIGTLKIEAGGHVTTSNQSLYIGYLTGANGTITVDGTGSTLSSGRLFLGSSGTGSLTVKAGASFTSAGNTTFGDATTGSATMLVTGSGSSWTATSGTFYIGNSGTGTLTVADGATVTSASPSLGYAAGSSGMLTVTGKGSTFTSASGIVNVGRLGSGTINVEAEGTASLNTLYVGAGSGATTRGNGGLVSVTGSNATLTAVNMQLGRYGDGELTVEDGGVVTVTGSTTMGHFAGGVGEALVTGEGSEWNTGTSLTIGRAGTGILIVADGGTVTVAEGSGTVTLGSDAGSGTLNIGSGAAIGTLSAVEVTTGTGTGQVNFNHTGTVTFAPKLTGTLAVSKLGTGTTILTGTNTYTGATWVNTGTFLVNGSLGATAVTVANGAMFGGAGFTTGTITLQAGAILTPGSGGVGTLTTGDSFWSGGATYEWELFDASLEAGSGWDLVNITGTLALDASSGNLFTISLVSVETEGALTGFDASQNYSFIIATTTDGIIGFEANAFTLDLSGFGESYTGIWSVGLTESGLGLVVSYSAVPEPAAYAAFAGFGVLLLSVRRRRAA